MKLNILTNIRNGKFKRNLPTILEAVKAFEGKDVLITFESPKKKRSNQQNSYYWGLLLPLLIKGVKDEWGEIWDTTKAHDFCKLHFNYIEKVNESTSEVIKIPKSTTENTTTQQEDCHAEIRNFLKEWFNIDAPLPNEDITLNFKL